MEELEFQLRQNVRVNDLRDQAVNDLIKSAYKKFYRKKIAEAMPLPYALQQVVNEVGVESFVSETRGRKKDTTRWFITISAKDNIDHCAFMKQMEKCVKKQKLQGSGKYVLEQRAEEQQDPYGWHIHWLVQFESQSSKATIVQQVYQCFARFVAGANYVDCRPVYSDEEYDVKLRYIGGDKKADKMAKVEKDRVLRKKYSIPDIISY